MPADIKKHVRTATKADLAVLIILAGEPQTWGDLDSSIDELAARADLGREEFLSSVSFWRGAGVITTEGELKLSPQTSSSKKTVRPKSEPTTLSAQDVSKIMSSSPKRLSLINACQQTMGKMFNTSEASVVLGLKEYLGVEDDYILMLAAYCVRRDKKSVKYLEKMAIDLYDREIDTTPALEEHLCWLEKKDDFESKLRRLLGTGARAFSKKEKACIERWLREFAFEFAVIELAYGKTVDAIGKSSVPYMDKILESWHAKGYKTVLDVESGDTGGGNTDAGSFDTDDFFSMAVKRGLKS